MASNTLLAHSIRIALLCLIVAMPTYAELYRSNVIGIRLEPISDAERNAYDYVLEDITTATLSIDHLYADGKEIRRTERHLDGSEMREYRDGILRTRTLYDANGRIAEETNWDEDGTMIERLVHRYQPGIGYIDAYDSQGILLYEEEQQFGINGALREVRRHVPSGSVLEEAAVGTLENRATTTGSGIAPPEEALTGLTDLQDAATAAGDGDASFGNEPAADAVDPPPLESDDTVVQTNAAVSNDRYSSYAYADGRLREERHAVGAHLFISRYDGRGRLKGTLELINNVNVHQVSFDYGDNPQQRTPLVESAVLDTTMRIERRYNAQHQLIAETTLSADMVMSQVDNSYEDGTLNVSVTLSPGSNMNRDVLHDQDGTLLEEIWTQDGVVIRVIRYQKNNMHVETLYRNGSPFVRIYYENDARLREEFVRDDQTIYTREFQ